MFFAFPVDIIYEPPQIVYEHVVHHATSSDKSSDESSEGMTNDMSSCWMLSVIQALRASSAFQSEYAPESSERHTLKGELFHLFDIVDGKNGEKKRKTKESETVAFKKMLIKAGLPVGMHQGFLEEPFLTFLLKKIGAKSIVYQAGPKKKEQKDTLLRLSIDEQNEPRRVQELISERGILFADEKSVPRFLPIHLDRPEEKRYYSKKHYQTEFSRVPVIPQADIVIPVADGKKKAKYELVSVVIGRDSIGHAYCYEATNTGAWIEYNDSNVILHENPLTEKRRRKSHFTPHEDAVQHACILIYQLKS